MHLTFKKFLKYFLLIILISSAFKIQASIISGSIDDINYTAQVCETTDCTITSTSPVNFGNFTTSPSSNVTVSDTELTGYIWGKSFGWAVLNCSNTSSGCSATNDNFKVANDYNGNLSGYAWGETSGWINFGPFVNNSASPVVINSSGQFNGYAWTENFGWIKFDCGTTNYCVQTDWRPRNTRPQCSDGLDNDGDGLIDTLDSGCHSDSNPNNSSSYDPTDSTEFVPGAVIFYPPDKKNKIDICPNISGEQDLIPEGLVINEIGDCVSPEQCTILDGNLKQPLDVMIVMDKSGSMSGGKITEAKKAASIFIDDLIQGVDRVGYVTYSDKATLVSGLNDTFSSVKEKIKTTKVGGATNIGGAIKFAHKEINKNKRNGVKHVIIILTDGAANVSDLRGINPNDYVLSQANLAKSEGVIIYTVGLGSDVNSNLLSSAATVPDNYYYAPNESILSSIYLEIAAISCTAAPSEISNLVIYDKNSNGKYNSGEVGLADISVSLISKDNSQPIRTLITEQDGSFNFYNVAPGDYSLCVVPNAGMRITSPLPNGCYNLNIIQGIDARDTMFLLAGNILPNDTDKDGLTNKEENNIYNTDPNNPDTDGDGFLDGNEISNGTDPLNPNDPSPVEDTDKDGLTNEEENNIYNTNPSTPDSDSDWITDSKEISNGTDPLDSSDPNNIKLINLINNTSNNIGTNISKALGMVRSWFLDTDLLSFEKIEGSLRNLILNPVNKMATNIIITTGLIIGAYSGVISVAFANPISFSELFMLPMRLWSLILIAFGFKRRNRPWGTVYDSATKQPLDPAYVVLQDLNGNEVATSITDLDGRYGFLVPAGQYRMVASKTNYKFPSKKLNGRNRDELYEELYFNEIIEVSEGAVITKNIPMDSIKFDWNEFAKKDQKLMKFFSRRELWIARISRILFTVGFLITIVATAISPVFYNILILSLYIILLIIKRTILKPRAFGYIRQKLTENPLSFAVMRVFFAGSDNEIMHKVADKTGKYYCLIPNGTYYTKIESKNPDESYSLVHVSDPIEVKKGFINRKFEI